jgi:hypothetical protein
MHPSPTQKACLYFSFEIIKLVCVCLLHEELLQALPPAVYQLLDKYGHLDIDKRQKLQKAVKEVPTS